MRRRTQPVMYMPRDAKVNEAQPKTAEQIFAEKDAKIAALEKELATLKEKLNTSTKFLKILRDEVADLADDSCEICRKPAGSCPGCVLLPCKETLECIDHMHPELIHQPEGDTK